MWGLREILCEKHVRFLKARIRSLFLPQKSADPGGLAGVLLQKVCSVIGLGPLQPCLCHSKPEATPSATLPDNLSLCGPSFGVGNSHPRNTLYPHFLAWERFHSASCTVRNRPCSRSVRGEEKTQGLREQPGTFLLI